MKSFIEILPFSKEKKIPLIKLTKSKKGNTGSATLLFVRPDTLNRSILKKLPIDSIKLIAGKKEIKSRKIEIIFQKGKPFLLKAIFIFPTKEDYLSFFYFINIYAKENKLSYFKEFENYGM